MGGWALLGVSEPASAQTSHSASYSTPLHTLPNPSLFMTTTTGLLLSNTCVHAIPGLWGYAHTSGMDMLLKAVPVGGDLL